MGVCKTRSLNVMGNQSVLKTTDVLYWIFETYFCFQIRCHRNTGQGPLWAKSLCYLQYCKCCTCMFCVLIQLFKEPDKQSCLVKSFIKLYHVPWILSFDSYFTIWCATVGRLEFYQSLITISNKTEKLKKWNVCK